MDIKVFSQLLTDICAHSLVAPDRLLKWTIIANPTAGGFTIRSRSKKHLQILEAYSQKAKANPLRSGAGPSDTAKGFEGGLIPTTGPGNATQIAQSLVDEAAAALGAKGTGKAAPFYLIITAGGDGTSLEVLTALYRAPASVRSSLAILRLPMGTGNDGADSRTLDGALDLLIKPVKVEYTPALRLLTAKGGPAFSQSPYLAFNILSIGLDAFVTHMTNKMKGKLPGDSYKLWVDVASLLYDSLYKVDFIDVKVLNEHKRELDSFREKLLLLAMGISGNRTYGSNKKILPDERNVCGIKQMPLLRKIALKDLLLTGKHAGRPEAMLFNAHRLEFTSRHPILAQMDGEAVLLQPADFPAAIELSEKVIPCLSQIKNHSKH